MRLPQWKNMTAVQIARIERLRDAAYAMHQRGWHRAIIQANLRKHLGASCREAALATRGIKGIQEHIEKITGQKYGAPPHA